MAFPQSSVPRDGNRVPALWAVSNSDGTTPVAIYADPSTHRLLINTSSSNPTPPSTLFAFVTSVPTAGTAVQLASNTITVGFILEAPSTNTGKIYIGGSGVLSSAYGSELSPGQATSISVTNTNLVYINASVNGDKCACLGS